MSKIPTISKKVFQEFTERFKQDKNKAIAWLFAYAYRKGQYDFCKEHGIITNKNDVFE